MLRVLNEKEVRQMNRELVRWVQRTIDDPLYGNLVYSINHTLRNFIDAMRRRDKREQSGKE
jgi:hypothetical protein